MNIYSIYEYNIPFNKHSKKIFYKLMVTERSSEMAKLIGCLQPAEPGKKIESKFF
jgi:high-affinity nickel permease